MLRIDQRAGGIGGGSGCNTMPPNPLEGDFLLVPPLLFVGLPSLQGDVLFGGPFLSWQVALSLTSPTLDTAAPDVDVPLPPSLHARHEEQCFFVPTQVIRMAALVAWPQRGKEGSRLQ
jgi:hypothetical protein